MHLLLVGYHPFYGENDSEILERTMIQGVYMNSEAWKNVSSYATHLLNLMLIKDPNKRVDIWRCFNDYWI